MPGRPNPTRRELEAIHTAAAQLAGIVAVANTALEVAVDTVDETVDGVDETILRTKVGNRKSKRFWERFAPTGQLDPFMRGVEAARGYLADDVARLRLDQKTYGNTLQSQTAAIRRSATTLMQNPRVSNISSNSAEELQALLTLPRDEQVLRDIIVASRDYLDDSRRAIVYPVLAEIIDKVWTEVSSKKWSRLKLNGVGFDGDLGDFSDGFIARTFGTTPGDGPGLARRLITGRNQGTQLAGPS